MSDYRLRKAYRLLKTDDFSSVFNFRRTYSFEQFQVYHKPNDVDHARLGLVVAKKVAKRAVARNTMKRIIREWFRLRRPDLKPFDLVVRVRRPFDHADTHAAWQHLDTVVTRIGIARSDPCPAYSSP